MKDNVIHHCILILFFLSSINKFVDITVVIERKHMTGRFERFRLELEFLLD